MAWLMWLLWIIDPYTWMPGYDDPRAKDEYGYPIRVHLFDPYHLVLGGAGLLLLIWSPLGLVLLLLEVFMFLFGSTMPEANGIFVRIAARRAKMFKNTRVMIIPWVTRTDMLPGDAEVTIVMNGEGSLSTEMKLGEEIGQRLLEEAGKSDAVTVQPKGEILTTPVSLDLTLVVRLAVDSSPWAAVRTFLPDFRRDPGLEIGPVVRRKAVQLITSTCDETLQQHEVDELRKDIVGLNRELTEGLQESLLAIGVHVTSVKIDASRGKYFDFFNRRADAVQERQTLVLEAEQARDRRTAQANADREARKAEADAGAAALIAETNANRRSQSKDLRNQRFLTLRQTAVTNAEQGLLQSRALRDLQQTIERFKVMQGQTYETVLKSLLDSMVAIDDGKKAEVIQEVARSFGKTPETVMSLGNIGEMYQLVALLRTGLEKVMPGAAALIPAPPAPVPPAVAP